MSEFEQKIMEKLDEILNVLRRIQSNTGDISSANWDLDNISSTLDEIKDKMK